MITVRRAQLDLGKLRTHLFKSEKIGRTNDELAAWLTNRGFWPDGDRWLGEQSALNNLPIGVVVDLEPPVRPKPWQGDPLYRSILEWADEEWDTTCRVKDSEIWKFVLVEEYAADDGSMCHGPVLRAWRRDTEGLHEICEPERQNHLRRLAGLRIYPFVLLTFHIQANGDRVIIGLHHATTAGVGGGYIVERRGDRIELLPDPTGGYWQS